MSDTGTITLHGTGLSGPARQSPFHPGERAAQARAGFVLPGAPIRDRMAGHQRDFFAQLPWLVAAVPDAAGWPVATALAGPPGFVGSAEGEVLHVDALPPPSDPALPGLRPGAAVGLLGIDLATRRRNRVNGTVLAVGGGGFGVQVRQSFGNCPKYIGVREVTAAPAQTAPAEHLPTLDAAARAMIGAADTFFVASTSGGEAGAAGGADASHRGGPPGFVRVEGDVLTVPDFRGNSYFNTLGNILLDPRVGLLFVDFTHGDLLHVQGRAEVLWADEGRAWRVAVTAALRRPGALPLRWSAPPAP